MTGIEKAIKIVENLSEEELSEKFEKSLSKVKQDYRNNIKVSLLIAINVLENNLFKRKYNFLISYNVSVEVKKFKKIYKIKIYRDDLTIEIPLSKSLEDVVDLIVEYS